MFCISKVFISRVFHYLGKCVHEKKKRLTKYSNEKMLKERNIGMISIGKNKKIQYIQDFNMQNTGNILSIS